MSDPRETPKKFKNRMAVLEELHQRGYPIKKSKLYNDVTAGLLQVEADKTVLLASVDKYILNPASLLESHLGLVREGKDVETLEQRLRFQTARTREKELKVEKLESNQRIEDGQYLLKEEVAMMLAGRASLFDQGLSTMVLLHVSDWIYMVRGDVKLAPVLVKDFLEKKDKMLTELVSLKEITMMVEDLDE